MLSLIMIGPATLCWMLKGNAAENCVVSMDTIQREKYGWLEEWRKGGRLEQGGLTMLDSLVNRTGARNKATMDDHPEYQSS